jgi:Uma2 family endonuclease
VAEPAQSRITYEEYLLAEEASETKHEYLGGEVFAMAGGTPSHSLLAGKVITALNNALADRPCAVFTSDLRIRIDAANVSTYPDIAVVCGSLESSEVDRNAATNPILIVEVLSDSTEAYDRGQKFAYYRELPSLREYVLVSQGQPRIESYYRNAEGDWVLRDARSGDTLTLRALEGVTLETDAIYRDPLATPNQPA